MSLTTLRHYLHIQRCESQFIAPPKFYHWSCIAQLTVLAYLEYQHDLTGLSYLMNKKHILFNIFGHDIWAFSDIFYNHILIRTIIVFRIGYANSKSHATPAHFSNGWTSKSELWFQFTMYHMCLLRCLKCNLYHYKDISHSRLPNHYLKQYWHIRTILSEIWVKQILSLKCFLKCLQNGGRFYLGLIELNCISRPSIKTVNEMSVRDSYMR